MHDNGLTNAKLEIVHEVDSLQWRWVETEFGNVCVLQQQGQSVGPITKVKGDYTRVGTHEPFFNGSYSPL